MPGLIVAWAQIQYCDHEFVAKWSASNRVWIILRLPWTSQFIYKAATSIDHVKQLTDSYLLMFQLQNLTLVSSDLQTRVVTSEDESETLLNNTLKRDPDLPGSICLLHCSLLVPHIGFVTSLCFYEQATNIQRLAKCSVLVNLPLQATTPWKWR